MAYVIGDPGLTWYKKQTTEPAEGSAGPQRMDETWVGSKSSYNTFKSGYIFGQTHSEHQSLTLHEVVPKMSGTFGQARLVWINAAQSMKDQTGGGPDGAGPPPPVGSSSRSMVSGELEIALDLNPNFSPGWINTKPGVESYMTPAPTLIYKYVSGEEFVFSEADLIKNVFKRTNNDFPPMGLDGDISFNNWLMWSREVSDEGGGIFVIASSWRWSPDVGWDTDLYDEAD